MSTSKVGYGYILLVDKIDTNTIPKDIIYNKVVYNIIKYYNEYSNINISSQLAYLEYFKLLGCRY